MTTVLSYVGARVGGELAPLLAGAVEVVALGDLRPAAHIVEGGLVGRDHSGAASALDGHIADGHAAFHGELAYALAGVLDGVAGGSGDAYLTDDGEDDVLGGNSEGQRAVHPYLHGLGLELA